jgi:hypothetical protein
MKTFVIPVIMALAALLSAQNSVTGSGTQVSGFTGEQEDNAGGKQNSRIGNSGQNYSMLVRVDLAGQVPTVRCTLYLVQMPAGVGSETFDYTDTGFNTRVSTVRGTWSTGSAGSESPQEGSVCYKYRAYSASSPTLWRQGVTNSTVEFESMGIGGNGTHVNSTDVYLNTAESGEASYVVLDEALIQDLASGACGGFRIKKATNEDAVEMRISNENISLAWDPTAAPILIERNVALPSRPVFNSPEPFSGSTSILYPGNGALVSIFDVSGALVRTLSGRNGNAVWNGQNATGRNAASGVYVYRLELGNRTLVRRMNLAR